MTILEITDVEIHQILAARKQIALIWSVQDVQSIRPDLDEDQSWEVLQAAADNHDCNNGLTWNHLQSEADHLFPEPTPMKA